MSDADKAPEADAGNEAAGTPRVTAPHPPPARAAVRAPSPAPTLTAVEAPVRVAASAEAIDSALLRLAKAAETAAVDPRPSAPAAGSPVLAAITVLAPPDTGARSALRPEPPTPAPPTAGPVAPRTASVPEVARELTPPAAEPAVAAGPLGTSRATPAPGGHPVPEPALPLATSGVGSDLPPEPSLPKPAAARADALGRLRPGQPVLSLPDAPPRAPAPAAPQASPAPQSVVPRIPASALGGDADVAAPPAARLEPARPVRSTAPPAAPEVAAAPPATGARTDRPAGWRTRAGALLRRALRIILLACAAYMVVALALIATFRFVDPPTSALMLLRRLGGETVTHRWVPMEAISPNLARAVVLSEDGNFCRHHGIDFGELKAAIERARDGFPRGASTITMQVAKNLLLLPVKSYVRKAIEVPLTLAIEALWTKRRILEVYLNIAEWGPGIFGAEAAARHHFDRPARRLTEAEAALLAVALPNPITRDAGDPGPGTERLAHRIQARMKFNPRAATCALP